MIYRDTTESDIRRGCEAFLATRKMLSHAGLWSEVEMRFDSDCAETLLKPWNDLHSTICVIGPQEDDEGYNVTRHGENQIKYTAVSAAIAAVQMVMEWRARAMLRNLPQLRASFDDVEEMVEEEMEKYNEARRRFDEARARKSAI